MSAFPVFPSAAPGRPFVLLPASSGSLLTQLQATRKLAALRGPQRAWCWPAGVEVTPASRLEVRPAPEMVSSGIRELDALTGGLPRGCLTEICGPVSSGRTTILLSAVARATQRGEVCALVDASDALDPGVAAAAGVEMGRLLWVRCGKEHLPQRHRDTEGFHRKKPKEQRWESRLEQVLKVTDLLLQSSGFGMIVLDLGDVPGESARRIPLASWFRFRRAVEHTPTVLLVVEQQPIAGSCASVLFRVTGHRSRETGKKPSAFSTQHSADRVIGGARVGASGPENSSDREISGHRKTGLAQLSHAELLDQFEITVELLRSRLERKPAQSIVSFESRAKWAG